MVTHGKKLQIELPLSQAKKKLRFLSFPNFIDIFCKIKFFYVKNTKFRMFAI